MKEYKIGEQFEFEGLILEVKENMELNCGDCYFNQKGPCPVIYPQCGKAIRSDNRSVIYKLVGKQAESVKNDFLDDKVRMDLLPWPELEEIAKVFTAGAKKYGPNRWKNLPGGYQRYKGALLRHLTEVEKGNATDTDTGCLHIAQVAVNAIFMLHFKMEEYNETSKSDRK